MGFILPFATRHYSVTTTRLRTDVIYAYAVASPNISQAFFSKMRDEIAGELDDISDERERPPA